MVRFPFQTAFYPRGKGGGGHGLGFEHRAAFGQGGKPFGLRLRLFQLGQDNDGNGVGGQVFRQRLQRVAAGFARLAAWDVDFQQFQVGKQPRAAGRSEQCVPVGGGFGAVAFTVEITLFFRGFAQGVEGFDAQ